MIDARRNICACGYRYPEIKKLINKIKSNILHDINTDLQIIARDAIYQDERNNNGGIFTRQK